MALRITSFALLLVLGAGCSCSESHQLGADAAVTADASSTTDASAPLVDAVAVGDDAASQLDAACTRPTGIDVTGLGASCADAPCATGLTCLDESGAVLQRFCGIPCEAANGGECACPEPLVCGERVDKAGTHHECQQPGS